MTRKVKCEGNRKYNAFKDILIMIKHYFPDFMKLLSSIDDPRHQSYIKYFQEQIVMTRLISYFCHHKSLRYMNESFNNDCVIKNFKILFGEQFEEVPHGDTINHYFEEASIEQFRATIYGLVVRDLIQKKIMDEYKINKTHYQIIIGGVDMYTG